MSCQKTNCPNCGKVVKECQISGGKCPNCR